MRQKLSLLVAFALASMLVPGCSSDPEEKSCTAQASTALAIVVLSSDTCEAVAATVRVNGTEADSTSTSPPTYWSTDVTKTCASVEISAPGYVSRTLGAKILPAQGCSRPVNQLTVLLQPDGTAPDGGTADAGVDAGACVETIDGCTP